MRAVRSLLPLLALALSLAFGAPPAVRAQSTSATRELLRQRAAALRDWMRRDPRAALEMALAPDVRDRLLRADPRAAELLETSETRQGALDIVVEDDFEAHRSRTYGLLHLDSEPAPVEVHFAAGQAALLSQCRPAVEVAGLRLGDRMVARSVRLLPSAAPAAPCAIPGEQQVAILLLRMPNAGLPAYVTPSLLQAAFNGPGKSVSDFFGDSSWGATTVNAAVFGPIALDQDYTCDRSSEIVSAAVRAAWNQVDFNRYRRIVVVTPNTGSCSIGVGLIGCGTLLNPQGATFQASWVVLRADYLASNDAIVSVAAHELGHSLGLGHANSLDYGSIPLGPPGSPGTSAEYNDRFSLMGYSYTVNGAFGLGHFAAPHKNRLGWIQNGSTVADVSGPGTYLLRGYSSPAPGGIRALRVRRGSGGVAYLWVEARVAEGLYDSTLGNFSPTAYSGALIHYETSPTDSRTSLLDFHPVAIPNDFSDAALRSGETWTDPSSNLSLTIGAWTPEGLTVTVGYSGVNCSPVVTPDALNLPATANSGTIQIDAGTGCGWSISKPAGLDWLTLDSLAGTGSAQVRYTAAANPAANSRGGTLTIAGRTVPVNQAAGAVPVTLNPTAATIAAAGGQGAVAVTAGVGANWSAASSADWIVVTSGSSGTGPGTVFYTVAANPGAARSGVISIGGATFTVNQEAQVPALYGTRFVPVTPCRVLDTRLPAGTFGGPSFAAASKRTIPIPAGSCNIPPNAATYSLNVTAVPRAGYLAYLTLWPAGGPQPGVSTLNAPSGKIVANAAIVPAGVNGAIEIYSTDAADVVLDINGYFAAPDAPDSLAFYPVSPCRVVDTRNPASPLGGPALSAAETRLLPLRAGNCAIPATARAYSLNATVVPRGFLGYLSLWPAGQRQPGVSTLNSTDGGIVANAAIVPAAAADGTIAVYATHATDLVLDINGYFAPPPLIPVTTGAAGLSLYAINPCRVVDTREARDAPLLAGGVARTWAVASSPAAAACSIPTSAQAYALNATVVPVASVLGYLTLWPAGSPLPGVSTLNSPLGLVLANAALVPAGSGGAISGYATHSTHVIVDVTGYFAP